MGMNVGGGRKGPSSEINVTPLIDVVLVLLIIFMVLTPIMLKELPANVPKKQESNVPPDPSRPPIVVEYTAAGELALNTEPVSVDALATKVAERLRTDRNKVVFFKIEDDANYGDTVKLMDICKGAGALTIGIMTKDTP